MQSKEFFTLRRKSVFTVTAILLVLFCVVFIPEIAVRILYHTSGYYKIPVPETARAEDAYEENSEYYGRHDIAPEVEYNTYLEYYPVKSRTGDGYASNNAGFRDSENISYEKKNGEIRIFILGGSFAWGSGVKQDKHFAHLLEKILRDKFPGKNIRVLNAAVGGFKSVQERILLENIVLSYAPDYVIQCGGWNDAYEGYSGRDIFWESTHLNYKEVIEGKRDSQYLHPPDYRDYPSKILFLFDRFLYYSKYPSGKELAAAMKAQYLPAEETVSKTFRNVHIIRDLSIRYGFNYIYLLQPTLDATAKKLTSSEKKLLDDGGKMYAGFPEYCASVYQLYRKEFPADATREGYVYRDSDPAIIGESKSVFTDQVHTGDRGHRLFAKWLAVEIEKQLQDDK